MKPILKKQGLNEAFKRFQRLPEWPIAAINCNAPTHMVEGVAVANHKPQRPGRAEEETDFKTLLRV